MKLRALQATARALAFLAVTSLPPSVSMANSAAAPRAPQDSHESQELRLFSSVSVPFDPLLLKSMGEYDLSLVLFQTMTNYDSGRMAVPNLAASWKFNDATGEYTIKIASRQWSDGSPLTADEIVKNLKRIANSKTQYAKSLSAIIDTRSLRAQDDHVFLKTKDKKPSQSLFNQLGSIFLSIVDPNHLVSKSKKELNFGRTLGPYELKSSSNSELVLEPSPTYSNWTTKHHPQRIIVRKGQGPDLKEFMAQKSWANYFQTTTFMTPDLANSIVNSKLSMWSRNHDRVAILKPLGKGSQLSKRKDALSALGAQLAMTALPSHPLRVALAKSLQPREYPLFQELTFSRTDNPFQSVTILAQDQPQTEFLREIIVPALSAVGCKAIFKLLSTQQFLAQPWDLSGADFALFSFGVADPEPSTWLSLLFGAEFIAATPQQIGEFKRLLKIQDRAQQVNGFKSLLKQIGEGGGYLPLAHGSTISLGSPNISFRNIDSLDETVNFSKIEVDAK